MPRTARDGAETRRQVQRVALELFTSQGYDATSMRQIAERIGINKASLYYHFPGKPAILRSLLDDRGAEAEELAAWIEAQPAGPDLLRAAVLRWVGAYSADKLAGIRFLRANPHVARTLQDEGDQRVGDPLQRVAAALTSTLPEPDDRRAVLVRMALLSINAAVEASADAGVPDAAVVGAARAAALALVERAAGGTAVDEPPVRGRDTAAPGR